MAVTETDLKRSFNCEECGAKPGNVCVYFPHANRREFVFSAYSELLSEYVLWTVIWDGHSRMEDQIYATARRAGLREGELPEIPIEYRRVGEKIEGKFVHRSRINALEDWRRMNDRLAMAAYLGEWLDDNASIFEETK